MTLACTPSLTFADLLAGFARQHPRLIALYFVLLLLIPIKDVGTTHFFGRIIQAIKDRATEQLRPLTIALLALIAVFSAVGFLNAYLETRLGAQFEHHVRDRMLRELLDMQSTHFTELETGQITQRSGQVPITIFNLVSLWRDLVVPRLLVMLAILLYLGYHRPRLALTLGLATVAVGVFFLATIGACFRHMATREQTLQIIFKDLDDLFKNLLNVLNSNQQAHESERLARLHDTYKQHSMDGMFCSMRTHGVVAFLTYAALVYVAVRVFQTSQASGKDLGFLVTVLMLLSMYAGQLNSLYDGVKYLLVRWSTIQESLALFRRCRTVAASAAGPAPPPPPIPPTGFALRAIHFTYEQEGYAPRVTFRGLSLDLPAGVTTHLVGPIGSGKSTLLLLLMRYRLPSAGEIYLDGVPYRRIPPAQLRRRIGYVSQTPNVFNRSVYDNIVYAVAKPPTTRPPSKTQVAALLRDTLGLGAFLDGLPRGLDTLCGKNGAQLSGGQRQIITLLRVLLQDPDVLLLDEPTASIDPATKTKVLALIERIMRGKTVVMVTHDPELIKHATNTVRMSGDGRVLEA
jgi:ATP-binding cassette, subfamily B, bacterial